MKHRPTVNIGNFLLSLSDAIDLASPRLVRHQQRVAFIAWEMAKEAGMPEGEVRALFSAALLHDVGAFSLEEKESLRTGQEATGEGVDAHCIRGERLLAGVPWLERSAAMVRYHHRHWDDWQASGDAADARCAQMLYLADRLERSIDRDEYILHQPRRLVKLIAEGAGTLFDPEVVELFNAVADREEFWLDMVSPRLYSILLHYGPQENVALDTASIRPLSELFKNMIDFRSRFTATHSSGVAACAVMLGRLFGLTETEVEWMEIAGHLHDLGKLAIPNTILDKPAGLTTEEFEVIRSHTYFTYMVLTSIKGMERIAEWGAFHHERLDGTGYPFHCKAGDIDTGARIMMVADLFTALVEDRPYRPGMPLEKALGIIQGFKERDQLDASIVDLAADNADELQKYVADHQRSAREFYEQQFADLETG